MLPVPHGGIGGNRPIGESTIEGKLRGANAVSRLHEQIHERRSWKCGMKCCYWIGEPAVKDIQFMGLHCYYITSLSLAFSLPLILIYYIWGHGLCLSGHTSRNRFIAMGERRIFSFTSNPFD